MVTNLKKNRSSQRAVRPGQSDRRSYSSSCDESGLGRTTASVSVPVSTTSERCDPHSGALMPGALTWLLERLVPGIKLGFWWLPDSVNSCLWWLPDCVNSSETGCECHSTLVNVVIFVDWFIPTLALRGMHQVLCTESAFCVRTVRQRALNGDRLHVSD